MIHYITTEGVGNAWVANELREVGRSGIPYVLHAMRRPKKLFHSSEWASQLDCETATIYPLSTAAFLTSVAMSPILFGGRFFTAFWSAVFGQRENWRARIAVIAHFFVACHWARNLRSKPVDHIHSQWAHSCATIGMYGAWLLGKTFSFTGHACDLFRDRVALADKIKRADFIVCISNFHRNFFLSNGARAEQLVTIYCGIDPSIFTAQAVSPPVVECFRIRAAGRLVEKKGFSYLVDACRLLNEWGVNFECTIGGSGPLEQQLRDLVRRSDLTNRITITGATIQQESIAAFMHSGDVFCLPCVWAGDGDVDGLPQMLMEAMACGLPVVSTRLVGIPDLVIDGMTGLLVEPNNSGELAKALLMLHQDQDLRTRLAKSGRTHVLEHFEIRNCLEPLIELYWKKLAPTRNWNSLECVGADSLFDRGTNYL